MLEGGLLVTVYILGLNLIGFLIMGYDKFAAIRGMRRVPEKTLFAIALFGGAVGVYLGMNSFRHKTKTPYFMYGVPALIVLNIVLYYLLFTN